MTPYDDPEFLKLKKELLKLKIGKFKEEQKKSKHSSTSMGLVGFLAAWIAIFQSGIDLLSQETKWAHLGSSFLRTIFLFVLLSLVYFVINTSNGVCSWVSKRMFRRRVLGPEQGSTEVGVGGSAIPQTIPTPSVTVSAGSLGAQNWAILASSPISWILNICGRNSVWSHILGDLVLGSGAGPSWRLGTNDNQDDLFRRLWYKQDLSSSGAVGLNSTNLLVPIRPTGLEDALVC